MKHSVDYNATISQLGTGDRFRTEERGVVHTVASADWSVDGTVVYVRTDSGETLILATSLRCYITQYAPRCGCGCRYELCEAQCVWPDELNRLFWM